MPLLPFLENGDDYGFFTAGRKCPCVPRLVVYVQEFLFSHTSLEMPSFPGAFVLFVLGFFFSCLMAQFRSWMENSDAMLGLEIVSVVVPWSSF